MFLLQQQRSYSHVSGVSQVFLAEKYDCGSIFDFLDTSSFLEQHFL